MNLAIKKNHGLTLTELIVASILMAIVMVGVAAVDLSMRSSYQTVSKDTDVAMRVAAAMLHITRNATIATGMRNDKGIRSVSFSGPPDETFTVIRQDVNDPSSYNEDNWVGYEFNATTHEIIFCPAVAKDGFGNVIAQICQGSATNYAASSSAYTLLTNVETFALSFDPDENLRNLYLDVSISGLYDLSQPFDVINNPRTTLTSRILPMQHTW